MRDVSYHILSFFHVNVKGQMLLLRNFKKIFLGKKCYNSQDIQMPKIFHSDQTGLTFINIYVILKSDKCPVSYTHLDVYKRQPIYNRNIVGCDRRYFCRVGGLDIKQVCKMCIRDRRTGPCAIFFLIQITNAHI